MDTVPTASWKYYMAMATTAAAATTTTTTTLLTLLTLLTTSLTTTNSFVVDGSRLVSVAEAFPTTSFSGTVRKSRYQTTTTTTSSLERFTRIRSITVSLLPNDDQNDNEIQPLRNENNVKKEEETEKRQQQEETQSWLQRRLQKADWMEIRRDAVLVTCFVLSRFLVYDILTSTKVTPGWVIQDVVWLTGTFSSATVLVIYWTMAGLLSKSFEQNSVYGPVQILVNVALCCPIWLATEHLLQFGPPNIGGDSLSQAIGTGFLGLASFMTLARALTSEWE
ncbi:hypothetical protein IV203_021243 [Nitzschia inconspicua]|uniref:Transmembrane protein n=1 Tax=Nitzschia inconspicua TaxID=303405 RepID=A0A9K3KGH7_9STRA|nr:hypothetical protein IV203_021243 [Nitzschia inconspicua]